MWRLIVSAILFFSGGLLLGGVLASYRIEQLQNDLKYLRRLFQKKDYLYVLTEEDFWGSFDKGDTLELIRDCRDGEGLFENQRGRTQYISFDYVKLLSNSIKKL